LKDRELSSKVLHQIDGDPNEEKNKREKLIEDARALYENSTLTTPQIIKILKISSHAQLQHFCRDYDFKSRRQKQLHENKIRDQKIIEYVKTHPSESIRSIALTLSINHTTISSVLRNNCIKKTRPSLILRKQKTLLIKKMLLTGKTNREIVIKLHINNNFVSELRKELNIKSNHQKKSLVNKIWLKIQKNKNNIFTYRDLTNKKIQYNTIISTLTGLHRVGKIIRVSPSHYKLNTKWRENKSLGEKRSFY